MASEGARREASTPLTRQSFATSVCSSSTAVTHAASLRSRAPNGHGKATKEEDEEEDEEGGSCGEGSSAEDPSPLPIPCSRPTRDVDDDDDGCCDAEEVEVVVEGDGAEESEEGGARRRKHCEGSGPRSASTAQAKPQPPLASVKS